MGSLLKGNEVRSIRAKSSPVKGRTKRSQFVNVPFSRLASKLGSAEHSMHNQLSDAGPSGPCESQQIAAAQNPTRTGDKDEAQSAHLAFSRLCLSTSMALPLSTQSLSNTYAIRDFLGNKELVLSGNNVVSLGL